MIITVLDNIVKQMAANEKDYLFDVGWQEWLNEDNDEFDAEKGLVLYDSASTFRYKPTQSGRVVLTYFPVIFFAFKSELEWDPLEHDKECLIPADKAVREFISLCENDNENIDSIDVIKEGVSIFNQYDVGISGILITFSIELRDNPAICVANG